MATKGLFLDLDGTLADSLPVMRETYSLFLQQFGIRGFDAEFEELNGPPLDRVVATLKSRYSLPEPGPSLLTRYLKMVKERYLLVQPNPGAAEILSYAVERGWTCAVVTSNGEDLTCAWLLRHHLLGAVSEVVGQESIAIGKPNPEPYLIALHRLGCKAEQGIAVEDSIAGMTSALAAKIQTFAYSPEVEPQEAFPAQAILLRHLVDLRPRLAYA